MMGYIVYNQKSTLICIINIFPISIPVLCGCSGAERAVVASTPENKNSTLEQARLCLELHDLDANYFVLYVGHHYLKDISILWDVAPRTDLPASVIEQIRM